VGAVVSYQDGACPSRTGFQFHRELEPGRASWVEWVLVIPHVAGAQQGLKGSGLGGGAGIPTSCGTGSRLGSGADWWKGSWCSWVRVWRGVASAGEGRVSHHVWVWNRAVAWCSLRDGEPGRTEQQLCRPMGRGFGRPAVLILDRGVVKPSMI
jgi:hypothetical protein